MPRSKLNYATMGFLAAMMMGCSNSAPIPAAPAPAQGQPKVVEAERFVLKSPTGRVIATLDNAPDETPILALFDRNGKTRLQISLSPGGEPQIVFSDKEGKGVSTLPAK
jgi:hypothetical protein